MLENIFFKENLLIKRQALSESEIFAEKILSGGTYFARELFLKGTDSLILHIFIEIAQLLGKKVDP
jgi:hypothetical protein